VTGTWVERSWPALSERDIVCLPGSGDDGVGRVEFVIDSSETGFPPSFEVYVAFESDGSSDAGFFKAEDLVVSIDQRPEDP
jgi:hypothetical protein